jgi:endonuclease YncB( thermonuclease family)
MLSTETPLNWRGSWPALPTSRQPSSRCRRSLWEYRGEVLKAVDGDTFWLSVDLGLDSSRKLDTRLAGLDCRALGTPEGDQALLFVGDWIRAHADPASGYVGVRTVKDRQEKFGRYLVTLFDLRDPNVPTLNDALLAAGLAKVWDGRGSHPW